MTYENNEITLVDESITNTLCYTLTKDPERSEWSCYMFGCGQRGIRFTPDKDKEPNVFWRKMQYLCFGHEWVKEKNQ